MDSPLQEALAQLAMAPRLAVALLLGGLIGFEREEAERPAGLRTHMLVCGTAALLMVLADVMVARYGADSHTRLDPIRVMEAIVGGIGFIGAGTIFTAGHQHRVKGLTTAASLLAVTGIGIGCGLGLYVLSALVAVTVVVILRVLAWIERRAIAPRARLAQDQEQD